MSDRSEVEAALTGENYELREEITLDIGRFTVPLFAIKDEGIELAGTGTLIAVRGVHFILTAAHVWKVGLKSATKVGIGTEPNLTNRFSIDTKALVPVLAPNPAPWDKWGPDIALLRIPPEYVGSISARRSFYTPPDDEKFAIDGDVFEIRVLMGTPHEFGRFSGMHADLLVNAKFIWEETPYIQANDQDYFDVEIDTSPEGTPKKWGGVSGGGLWLVYVYCKRQKGKIEWTSRLQGLAFWEEPIGKDRVVIRCHGPKSIGVALSLI